MAEYELMLAMDAADEAGLKESLEAIKQQIDKLKGAIVKQDDWGEKQTAYELKKRQSAWYTVLTLEIPQENSRKLVKQLALEKSIVRSLLTKPTHVRAKSIK